MSNYSLFDPLYILDKYKPQSSELSLGIWTYWNQFNCVLEYYSIGMVRAYP